MEDNARFCLYCMQKLKSPILMDFSFPFSRFSGSKIRVALGILLVALIGSGAAILVSTYAPVETPSNTSVFSSQSDTETSSSLTASSTPTPSNTESPIVSTSSSPASSLVEEEQSQTAAVTSQTSGSKEESNFKPSSSQPESFDESVSSSSLPNMTAQEMMDAIFEKERNTLSKKYPNLTWSDEELGEDSRIEQTQIYYGEDLDQLEEAFPNMEKNTEFFYSLKQSGDQRVRCLVRADKETGETKLVCWTTDMDHTGIANRISIGDSYERILAEYPDAMCSTEVAYGAPRKYNPETDSRVSFVVYMDENGNTYSPVEYEKKRFDSIREQGNFDLAKWYGLYFTVENGRITMIDFGDLGAIQQGR